MAENEYTCPECGGGYKKPEKKMNKNGSIDALFCPHCDNRMGSRITARKNIEKCPHNATTDTHRNEEAEEVCQECGVKWDLYGKTVGIKKEWNPAFDEYIG